MARKLTTKRRGKKHCFEFTIPGARGAEPSIIKVWCKVINGRHRIALPLMREHIERAKELNGIGNTRNCSMAICAQRMAGLFPHPVHFIDWQYRTCYVVSKLDKNGMPKECVRYDHSDKTARLNDTPGGLEELLESIDAHDGQIDVILRPYRANTLADGWTKVPRTPGRKLDGSRKRSTPLGMGAKRRFAVAFGGRLPPGTTTIDNSK